MFHVNDLMLWLRPSIGLCGSYEWPFLYLLFNTFLLEICIVEVLDVHITTAHLSQQLRYFITQQQLSVVKIDNSKFYPFSDFWRVFFNSQLTNTPCHILPMLRAHVQELSTFKMQSKLINKLDICNGENEQKESQVIIVLINFHDYIYLELIASSILMQFAFMSSTLILAFLTISFRFWKFIVKILSFDQQFKLFSSAIANVFVPWVIDKILLQSEATSSNIQSMMKIDWKIRVNQIDQTKTSLQSFLSYNWQQIGVSNHLPQKIW